MPAGSSKEFPGGGKSLGDPWGSGMHQGRRHSWSISGALPLQVLPQRLPKALSAVRAGQVHLKQQKSSCPAQLRAAVRHRHIPAQSQRLFPDGSRLAFPADSSPQQGQPGWAGEPRAFSQGFTGLRQLGQEEAHLAGRGSTGWKTSQPRGILCFFVWLRVPAPASPASAGKLFCRAGFGWLMLPGDPCELLKAQMENKHRLVP